jgi:uncharacterized protein YegL
MSSELWGLKLNQLNRGLVELADVLHIEPVKVNQAAGGA